MVLNHILQIFHKFKERLYHCGLLNIMWTMRRNIRNGEKVYKTLTEKYKGAQIYVEHYPGTGDIYITCALLKGYHIRHFKDKPFVVTVIGNGAKKIATLLGIQQIEVLSQKDSDDMIAFFRFMGFLPDFTVLHFGPIAMHTRILDSMAGFNGLDFLSLYLNTVFKGMSWEDADNFSVQTNEDEIKEYLAEQCLEPGRTVVLFPYANTIEALPMELWEEFARHLREMGFSVCTNVDAGGEVIPGTDRVFVPYKDIKAFVEKAGYLVSIRSGMCDILADSECRKFILYPTPNFFKFGVGSLFDYFSLIKMKIGKHIYEYEFERIYTKDMFKRVFWDLCRIDGIPKMVYQKMYCTQYQWNYGVKVCSDDVDII